jgi:WD40 repeat protein
LVNKRQKLEQCSTAEARLWSPDSGKVVETLPGVTAADFSPDGKLLALGSLTTEVTIRLPDGKGNVFRSRPLPGLITSVTFSPCGRWLAASWLQSHLNEVGQGDKAGSIRQGVLVWSREDGREYLTLDQCAAPTFGQGGDLLATASVSGPIHLWHLPSRKRLKELTGHAGKATALALAEAGPGGGWRLASGGSDRTIRLWDVETGRPLLKLTGHSGAVNSLQFAGRGDRLYSAGADGSVRLWKLADSTARTFPVATVLSSHLSFTTDARFLVLSKAVGVEIFDLTTGRRQMLGNGWRGGAVARRAPVMATGKGSDVVVLDTTPLVEGKPPSVRNTLRKGHEGEICALAVTPDGRRIASASLIRKKNGSLEGDLAVWDVAAGTHLLRKPVENGPLAALALDPPGQLLATVALT